MAQLHPVLLERIGRVLAAMQALGHPCKITQGVRTVEQQQALYAQGRTKPGRVVTNADGVVKKSNHQAGPDGFGRAVDLAFLGSAPFAETHPWKALGACGEAVGLTWGGNWTSIVDRPHFELPKSVV